MPRLRPTQPHNRLKRSSATPLRTPQVAVLACSMTLQAYRGLPALPSGTRRCALGKTPCNRFRDTQWIWAWVLGKPDWRMSHLSARLREFCTGIMRIYSEPWCSLLPGWMSLPLGTRTLADTSSALMPVVHWPTFSQQLVAREDERSDAWRAFVLSLGQSPMVPLPVPAVA